MTVKIEVKWKFKVNGKEYASREEMPENIRHAYDKALANAASGNSASLCAPTTRIVFNGQEYASVDSMPADVRQTYEEALSTAQGVEAGDSSFSRGRTKLSETILTHHGHTDWAMLDKAIEPGTSASSSRRLLVIGFLVLALLCALYFFIRAS
ncbi:MAG: hypothetical protein ACLP5H_08935 [Desulfomonilaceae bacterium]